MPLAVTQSLPQLPHAHLTALDVGRSASTCACANADQRAGDPKARHTALLQLDDGLGDSPAIAVLDGRFLDRVAELLHHTTEVLDRRRSEAPYRSHDPFERGAHDGQSSSTCMRPPRVISAAGGGPKKGV